MPVNYFPAEFEVLRNYDKCIQCRACERQCSNKVHWFDSDFGKMLSHDEKCVDCQRCVSICPTGALKIRPNENSFRKSANYTQPLMTEAYRQAGTGSVLLSSMGTPKDYPVYWDKILLNASQVTNPPIDAIREEIVTSTTVYIGEDGNILEEKPENCNVIKINDPILTSTDILKLKSVHDKGFKAAVIPMLYYKNTRLDKAVRRLFLDADKAHRDGANILILSDRGVDENHLAIPSLLAVSALHQHLVVTKRRTSVAVVLESGEPREVHHFAALLGYGASAINPYLAHETIHELIDDGLLDKDYYAAVDDYNSAVLHGIVKIASKMGISTIQSYQGSQIFEAIGISREVIDEYFTGTVSRIGGITMRDIERNVDRLHTAAFDPLGLAAGEEIPSRGSHKFRSGGEEHLYNPQTIHLLQLAARTGDYGTFKKYSQLITEEMDPVTIRGLFDFNFADTPVPLDEVESAESIVKRFKTGAMSYGSISG